MLDASLAMHDVQTAGEASQTSGIQHPTAMYSKAMNVLAAAVSRPPIGITGRPQLTRMVVERPCADALAAKSTAVMAASATMLRIVTIVRPWRFWRQPAQAILFYDGVGISGLWSATRHEIAFYSALDSLPPDRDHIITMGCRRKANKVSACPKHRATETAAGHLMILHCSTRGG